MTRWGWKAPHAVMLALWSDCEETAAQPMWHSQPAWLSAPAASCPERWLVLPRSMMGTTCAATCAPHTGPTYLPASTGPNLFRKHMRATATLCQIGPITRSPPLLLDTKLAAGKGGWWWSLKGPTYYWYTGLTAIGRIKCQLGGHRVDNSYVMESAEPFSPRGPSSRVPICHKCAQEMIVRGCFARLVALLRQFPPRPNIHSAEYVLCCVVQVAHLKGNGVTPCGGGACAPPEGLTTSPIDSHSSRPAQIR